MLHQGFAEDDESFRDLALELHRELGLKPWHPLVFDVGSIAEDGNAPDEPVAPSRLADGSRHPPQARRGGREVNRPSALTRRLRSVVGTLIRL